MGLGLKQCYDWLFQRLKGSGEQQEKKPSWPWQDWSAVNTINSGGHHDHGKIGALWTPLTAAAIMTMARLERCEHH
jgi:hypothetical protein